MKREPIAGLPARVAPSAAYAAKLRAPFAVLGIRTRDGRLTGVEYLPLAERAQRPADAFARQVVDEIERYLADPRHRFTLPLDPVGTPFQRDVWTALRAIPFGATASVTSRATWGPARMIPCRTSFTEPSPPTARMRTRPEFNASRARVSPWPGWCV